MTREKPPPRANSQRRSSLYTVGFCICSHSYCFAGILYPRYSVIAAIDLAKRCRNRVLESRITIHHVSIFQSSPFSAFSFLNPNRNNVSDFLFSLSLLRPPLSPLFLLHKNTFISLSLSLSLWGATANNETTIHHSTGISGRPTSTSKNFHDFIVISKTFSKSQFGAVANGWGCQAHAFESNFRYLAAIESKFCISPL